MFKDEKEFKKFVDKLNIDTKSNSTHREKLKKQMLSVFDETSKQQKSGTVISLEYIRNKIMKSPITKIAAAAVLIIVLFLTINSSGTLYAQVTNSLRKADTLHVSGEYWDGEDLHTFDTWYSKDIGLSRYDYRSDQTTIRLYDNSHMWQYSFGNKYAIQSNNIDSDYFINELLNITPSESFIREASGDKDIDGFQCQLYASYNDDQTISKKIWLDDMKRVRYTEYTNQKQDGSLRRRYSHFKYDITIDNKVFSKDFGENVTIVDSERMLNEMFSIENAVYSEETLGMIYAIHTAELCSDGTVYVICSVRPDENSWQIVTQRDPRSYNFGRSILNNGNNIELAQAYHNGIEIKWYAIYDSNSSSIKDNTLRINTILENNGELEKYRKANELAIFKTITQSVPLTKTNRFINEIIEDVYSQATLLESEIATVRLDISSEVVPDTTGQSSTGIAYKQRFKAPSEISLKEYMDEIMINIERFKQINVAISDIKDPLSESEPEPESEEPPQVTQDNKEPNEPKIPIEEIKTGVTGIVIDKNTYKPIQGAQVGFNFDRMVTTNDEGYFQLIYTGSLEEAFICITATDYASQRMFMPIKTGEMQNVTIELNSGSKIAGTVMDPNGQPIQGAQLGIFGALSYSNPEITNEQGHFEIDGLDPLVSSYQIHATHPLYPQVSINFKPAAAGQVHYQDIILKSGVIVFGQVTNSKGEPVKGVTVGNTDSPLMWNVKKYVTKEDGTYVFDNIDTEKLTLWAVHNNYAPFVYRTTVDLNQSQYQIDIKLPDPCELKGTVLDSMGNPITGISVVMDEYNDVINISDNRYKCNSDGRFIIPNAPKDGNLMLYVFGEGISGKDQKVDFSLDEQVIIIEKSGRIYGSVIDTLTNKPIKEFNVKMTFTKTGNRGGGYSATWSREGHTFNSPVGYFDTGRENLPIGKHYRVTISADGYDPVTDDLVIVQPISEHPERTVFKLQQAKIYAGRVITIDGQPIQNASVAFFSDDNVGMEREIWPRAITDSKGIFTISELGNFPQCIFVSAVGYTSRVYLMSNLLEKDSNFSDITLGRSASLSGYVYDENGKGLANAKVGAFIDISEISDVLTRFPSLGPNAHTNKDGHYVLSDVPTGDVQISVMSPSNYNIGRKKIKLEPGDMKELDFGNEGGYSIFGNIRDGSGTIKQAEIILQAVGDTDGYFNNRVTGAEGQFKFIHVPTGTYMILVIWEESNARDTTKLPEDRNSSVWGPLKIESDMELDIDIQNKIITETKTGQIIKSK